MRGVSANVMEKGMTFRLACDGKEVEVNMMYRKCANYFKADAMRNRLL